MKIRIDLLPQEKKKELNRKKIFGEILSQEILFIFPIIVLIIILANVYFLVKMQYDTVKMARSAYQAQNNYQQLSSYEDTFSHVNDSVSQIKKIQDKHLDWINFFNELNTKLPENITITEISSKGYQLFITGKAKTRDDLLKFRDNLNGSECFQSINVPLSDLVTKQDVDFQMDFAIKKECLLKN